jgi:hypothetical protein
MKHLTAKVFCLFIFFLATTMSSYGQAKQSLPLYHIYAGNTHAHTAYTWSHGSHLVKGGGILIDSQNVAHPKNGATRPDWQKWQGYPADHYAAAKDNGLDFYVITDHSQEADFHPTGSNSTAWVATKKAAIEATNKDLVGLVGYEHSENNGPDGKGHINVINSATYLNALEPGIDLHYLYKWLATVAANGEGAVVATFNHPAPGSYNSFAFRDPKVTDVITMLEVINSNKNVHYGGFISALDSGWKVSPVAGNDNHGLGGIKTQNARTFVLATSKTKSAILDAMKNRRTYASFDRNISCRYTVNGKIMGSTLTEAAKIFQFNITVSDPDSTDPKQKITKIDIVKDGGEVVETYSPAPAYSIQWKPAIKNAGNKYFFVRVWNAGSSDTVTETPESADSAEGSEGPVPKTSKPSNTPRPIAWLAPVWTGN